VLKQWDAHLFVLNGRVHSDLQRDESMRTIDTKNQCYVISYGVPTSLPHSNPLYIRQKSSATSTSFHQTYNILVTTIPHTIQINIPLFPHARITTIRFKRSAQTKFLSTLPQPRDAPANEMLTGKVTTKHVTKKFGIHNAHLHCFTPSRAKCPQGGSRHFPCL
jgi:hypothetical protein